MLGWPKVSPQFNASAVKYKSTYLFFMSGWVEQAHWPGRAADDCCEQHLSGKENKHVFHTTV